jgi:hypothetical protein
MASLVIKRLVFTAFNKSLFNGSGSWQRLLINTSAISGAVVSPLEPRQVNVAQQLAGSVGEASNGFPTPNASYWGFSAEKS